MAPPQESPPGGPPPPATPPATPPAAPDAATTPPAPAATPPATPPAAAAPPAGAPDKYALTLPEGGVVDADDVAVWESIGRKRNLTNEQLQAEVADHAEAVRLQNDTFKQQLVAHGEIGGAKLEAAQANANKFMDKFLPPDSAEGAQLRSMLTKAGITNFTPLVLMLARAGAAMGEDRPLGQGDTGGGKKSVEDIFYGGGNTQG
jgi:hypothetical protein